MSSRIEEESFELAARLQDAFMSMEAAIPEIVVNDRVVQFNLNQVRTLHFIGKDPGIHQKDVAIKLAITQASVSLIIGKLTALGLIEKRPDNRDGRSHGLHLASVGVMVYGEIRREQIAVMHRFLSVVSLEEQRILVAAIEKASAHLDRQEKLNS